ncbi:amino acid adenylation domain-containing protein [Nocardia sp. CDC159]|uniref:Amino acid adenylation domain-containing protein n=1 Tax=Nocardia pulmonis TaxID=2951408 RepID=A0A9X2IXL1_9NOCA|nr:MULTISPECIES: non-ribosomal peptide synthetase [Nocardia]MCM6773980.1 amino acid adenylation domain-containing protein [Nocardia pulmonis]MCM6786867.1 amino acid adenylation domain-containing protein [Nocardia sp. CDC159]
MTALNSDVLTLTDSQKGLLVVDGWVPTPEIYNQLMRFDIDPELPESAVAEAIYTLVTIQPALRQVFRTKPEFHALFAPTPPPEEFPLEVVETDPDTFEDGVWDVVRRIGSRPFDLAVGPAYRFGHVRADDGSAAAVLLCGHHVVGDGISMGPIIRDLQDAITGKYDAEAISAKQAERERAFVKELAAQDRATKAAVATERAKIWAKELADVPPLVLDPRPDRPTETKFRGARLDWRLTEEQSSAVNAMCKRLSVSPFVLFTALYGATMARHAGVERLLVGSPFAARRTVKSFDLVGFFVQTLPVTVEVDWTRTVDEHIGRTVRDAVDYCRSNLDISFNQLVAEVGQDRTSNRNPLFACMLAMQDTYVNADKGPILGVSEPGNGTAKFDLWLGATPVDGCWLLELEYDIELIRPEVAEGILDSLRTALPRALADGSAPLAALFADASLAQSLPAPAWQLPGATLTELIDAAALRTPDAVAVEEPGKQLTYAELITASEQVAAGLIEHGTAAQDVVAIATETLVSTVVAMLAILRCGATFLPVDLTLPAERLAGMLSRSGCKIVIGDGVDAPGVRTIQCAELCGPARIEGLRGDPEAAAYLMFTSGSTGVPKGVLMGQRPLLNLAAWQLTALDHGPETRFFQYAPLGFDVSYQEIIPTLMTGGTVVSRQPVDRRDFPALVRRVAETAVTHLFLPVAALRPFVQAARAEGLRFPALTHFCVSGEQLLVDEEIRAFFVEHERCKLINLYGPTETNAVTEHTLRGPDGPWPVHVPIGSPMPGVAAYIVDTSGHLAPVGVPGELYIGGSVPADGYLDDPERTAAGFLPDRFAGAGRMYRTGDQVVRDVTGALIFLGRRDAQLKIRGYRVELGEIEAVATRAAGVAQAVAVAHGSGAERELVLFLRWEGDAAPDHAAVRTVLSRALPAYQVPTKIYDIDTVPTSRTGKTDRNALVALIDTLTPTTPADAPEPEFADDLERELAEIWAGILEVERLERDRSLLEYGAHSLNVFTAFAQIEERYGTTVEVPDFFRDPTIAALADLVREKVPA